MSSSLVPSLALLLLAASAAPGAETVATGKAAKVSPGKAASTPAAAKPFVSIDPTMVDEDFPLQGEYVGKMREEDFAIQVIALGKGQFDAVMCRGGLPGAGWKRSTTPRQRVTGHREGEGAGASVRFSCNGWSALLKGDEIQLLDFKGPAIGSLHKVRRESPTLGAKVPEGAVVLFNGKGLDAFKKGARQTPDGLLMEGCSTVEELGSGTLHLEFMLSYMPEARGQSRSNSGVFLSSRYEVQVLDSFGLNGENNECGGIYTIARPMLNMCLPPLVWQTYDIDFQAPLFDEAGRKTDDARMTVRHNGVVVQDDVAVPRPTTAAPLPQEAAKGPLYLQNHGNPVRYRNIWWLPK